MGAIKDKIAGKAKQVEGKLTGDKVRMAQGKGEEIKGDVEGKLDRVGRKMKSAARSATSKVKSAAKKLDRRARKM